MMRHEIMLCLAAVIVLVGEIFVAEDKKKSLIPVALLAFAAVTIIGFIPVPVGELFGGMYRSSILTYAMKNILNLGVLIVFLQSAAWMKTETFADKISEYFILLLSTLIGMNFMISSGDFLMFYLGLELATIPLAALAAFDKFKNHSAEAGIKFILSSALSSGILLYGISMIYGSAGSIYFAEIATTFSNTPLQVFGLIFFIAGMGFKISLVPFHLWTADVYEGAPVTITAYFSVISKGAAAFIFTIFSLPDLTAIAETTPKAARLVNI